MSKVRLLNTGLSPQKPVPVMVRMGSSFTSVFSVEGASSGEACIVYYFSHSGIHVGKDCQTNIHICLYAYISTLHVEHCSSAWNQH
jgi:hypothetical protein